ncbi:helix-turn-helix domain-containing protein [Streptomyces sp. NBC_01280]|uniref:helix-turn-helix domain-containing protein n=1 Tax=Streptomyces sp. NBC_01280 TaxID=2903810 RepID=UPI002E346BBE|nr:helix-turn-helix transcriptional regulator [Streptomyces sp. NBC_01280]
MDEERAQRIGVRVRAARRQRGMSLRSLAQLAGVSIGFLSMVENGQRLLDRASQITALAEVLRMAPAELVGAPLPPAGPDSSTVHEMIPVLRHTLMGVPLESPPGGPPADQPLSALGGRVTEANRLYHAAAYDTLAAALPTLLADLHTAVAVSSGPARFPLLRLLAAAYHPACTLLLKNLGYTDLAFIAVTRATEAVRELDDPVHCALSRFFRSHVLMTAGSPLQAVNEATTAMQLLESQPSTSATHALRGELHLISASAIAQDRHRAGHSRTAEAEEHLTEAARLAAHTGETSAWHLNFGPTNVGIHQVTLHTDLGMHGEAVMLSSAVHPRALTVPGRQAAFHADLGRSLAQLRGRERDAVHALLAADHIAPQRIRANPLVRDTVGFLTDRQLPGHAARDLRGLAHRMGMPI